MVTPLQAFGIEVTKNDYLDNTLSIGDMQISRCRQYNNLGVLLDECLNLRSNFNSVFYKIFFQNITIW